MTRPAQRRSGEGGARRARAILALCASFAAACSHGPDTTPPQLIQTATAAPAAAGETVPHGDHNPHFGGLVLMNGDLHFEVVLARNGSARVYFSDATRSELPAATASEVTVTITRKSQAPEIVALHIDESGESWVGRGSPVVDPEATARVAYSSHGKPYFIDVPFPSPK
jgi:hypothetical protein